MNLSYVLPVYNEQARIAEAVKSLLTQNVPGKIIVINDGSTDNTRRILDQFEDKIKIIDNPERKGAAYSRNVGNALVEDGIIVVCDCDISYPDRSQFILEFFKQNPEASVFFSAINLVNGEYKNSDTVKSPAISWNFKSKCTISHPTVAYLKDAINDVKYIEKTVESDLYEFFLLALHKKGCVFGGTHEALVLKSENISNRNIMEAKKIKEELYKKEGIKLNGPI